MNNVEVAMSLIGGAGDSRAFCMEAINHAKEGRFDEARDAVKSAVSAMVETHKTQTQLICSEMEGKGELVSLLMVHAQDHLNLAIVMRDVVEEFITVYERLDRLERGSCGM